MHKLGYLEVDRYMGNGGRCCCSRCRVQLFKKQRWCCTWWQQGLQEMTSEDLEEMTIEEGLCTPKSAPIGQCPTALI